MKIKKFSFVFFVLTIIISSLFSFVSVSASTIVYLGGFPAGFSIESRGAYVNGICEVVTDNGLVSPALNSEIKVGDSIYAIDNIEVNNALDIEKCVKSSNKLLLTINRNGEIITKEITPAKDLNGNYRLGILVRDKINGIGTITFIKDGKIASLGHPVLNERGELINMTGGQMFNCFINGVIKGQKGKPGELRGVFNKNEEIANLTLNDKTGIYAKSNNQQNYTKKIEIGEAKIGEAKIYSTVKGEVPKEYTISIVKVNQYEKDNKNFVIKITDKELLDITGGIVQGMSGSPIIQNNKLVGAITHVFINDPTRGFGISIDKMLNNL